MKPFEKQSTLRMFKLNPKAYETDSKVIDVKPESFQLVPNILTKSSMYAVSQMITRGRERKWLWFLVLLLGLMGCLYETYHFIFLYFKYPVVITLGVKNDWKLQFPAVTICNLNRSPSFNNDCINGCKLQDVLNRVKNNFKNLAPTPSACITGRRNFSCPNNLNGTFNYQSSLQMISRYLNLYQENDKVEDEKNKIIKTCSFNGESCSIRNFTDFPNIQFEKCLTFNGRSNDKYIETSYIGTNSGLEISFNLSLWDNISKSPSLGLRVIIHDSDFEPNPENNGINISPGYETSLALKQTSVYRLPYPYRDHCRRYDRKAALKALHNQEACLSECHEKENFNEDGNPDHFAMNNSNFLPEYRNITSACCLNKFRKTVADAPLPCVCPLPCKSTRYEITISTSGWPSFEFFQQFIKKKKLEPDAGLPSKNQEDDPLKCPDFSKEQNDTNHWNPGCDAKCEDIKYLEKRNHLAKLKVFFRSLEKNYCKQEAMFQESELFSHLGGQLGLWLGVSLVAIFECVEVISLWSRRFVKNN